MSCDHVTENLWCKSCNFMKIRKCIEASKYLHWRINGTNANALPLLHIKYDVNIDLDNVSDIFAKTYIYIYCTVNMGLTVSDKSVFPTSFGRGRFQGNLFSFEKQKWLQKIFI